MTDYKYISLVICNNKDAGNFLANLAAAFPNDPDAEMGTFDDGRRMAVASNPDAPIAWYAEIPSKSTMAGAIGALRDGAGYDDERIAYLRERGLTSEQWLLAKSIIPACDVYDSTGGYQPDAMANLAATNGYVIVEVED